MSSGREPGRQRGSVVIVISRDEHSAEVTIEGRTQVVTGSIPKETRRAALDVATGYAAHLSRSVLVNARDANGSWQLIISPTGVVRAAGGSEAELVARPSAKRQGKGKKVALALSGGALAVVAAVGVGVVWVWGPDLIGTEVNGGSAEESGVILETRAAPPGFSREAAWRLPTRTGTRPALAPDGSLAAFINPNDELVVVDPKGEQKWSAQLPLSSSDIAGAPVFVATGDGYGVAITDNETLWQWPAGGGDPEAIDLPDNARVTFAGTSPLVLEDDRAYIPDGEKLKEVKVPSGFGAMLADTDRVLMGVRTGRWTWVDAGAAKDKEKEIVPKAPSGADRPIELLTAGADYVVVLWKADGGGDDLVALHDAEDGSAIAAAEVDADDVADVRWVRGGSLAAYGPVIFDLAAGEGRTLNGFTPASVAGDLVYGDAGGAPVAIPADGDPIDMDRDAVRPWGLLDDRALVIADGDLYALSPE
ncbi:hypothetical protein CDO52_17790 [Nocardiopsis gilva YIM 90087]|uniref:Uncharacterized protein n=1 Tax=Nocardiopsis gilva YIM 90087 TaxID=1235441 RepID=A0A223S8K0_9ACTN|nr:hypothetical protein [Nocardiopsis gilva]ASU84402.1 hypothetical protein CDO52_17790 [Nocardiopsis gilva YIM 90087]